VTTIRSTSPLSDPAWADLMAGPRGSGFGAQPWLRAIFDTYGFDLSARVLVDDDGRAAAGFTYADIDDIRGRRLVSVPFCDYLDPVVDDDEQWHALVDPLVERGLPLQVKVLHCDVARNDTRFERVNELAWHGTDLDKDEEAMFAALDRRARQNVRAAQRHGVTARFGSDIEDVRAYHQLHVLTRKRKHGLLAQPVSFFENIWKQFAPTDSVVVGFAEHEGDVIAASFYLAWNNVWYYKFSASIFDRSVVRPNELLAWESMRVARERGCLTYDWGVSDLDQPGLVSYKRKLMTEERRVTVLRYAPDGYANPRADETGAVLGELTTLLTREDVPDEVTQRGGEILYRYFT
jgi:CelD/BcsL family acetyltransferase involved in cellulose biosynthesis